MLSTTGKSIGIACTIAAALAVSIAPAASAKGGNGTRIAGVCSASSTSFLKAKQDNGRIEVQFEVDQNRTGVPWNVTLVRSGKPVFAGTRTTGAPSGSFSVERKLAGGMSPVIRARATRNGETCTASLKVGAATLAAPAPAKSTTAAAAGVKLRGDGSVDDNSVAAPVAGDDHGGSPASAGGNAGSGRNGGDDGAEDNGHHGNDD